MNPPLTDEDYERARNDMPEKVEADSSAAKCPNCHGTGNTRFGICAYCRGTGRG